MTPARTRAPYDPTEEPYAFVNAAAATHTRFDDPRRRRDSNTPLGVAAVAALLLHAAALPWLTLDVSPPPRPAALPRVDVPQAPPPPAEDEPQIGKPDSTVSSVAWIDYRSFEELMARKASTLQPALQQLADPVEHAPPELDPTPPAPVARPGEAAPPVMAEQQLEMPSVPGALAMKQPLPLPNLKVEAAEVPFAQVVAPPEAGERREEDAPTPQAPQPEPVAAAAAAPPSDARPTSSPRSDREAPPVTTNDDQLAVKPGRVLAAPGLEIKTVAPRFSIPARFTTPINPEAVITFDHTGKVLEVTLTRSSGYANVDGPVLASLYAWRAAGERIENMTGTLKLNVKILLGPE